MMNDKLQKLGIVLNEIRSRVSTITEKQAAAENKIPQVLETLVAHGRITPEQKTAAAALLRDPESCFDFIAALARHKSPSELGENIGVPVSGTVKTASTTPVGASPVDWDETEAGRQFKDRILAIAGLK